MGWWGCPVRSQLTFVLGVDSCLCVCPLVFVGVCCPLVFVALVRVGFSLFWVCRSSFVRCFCGRLLSLVVVCGLLGCPVLLSFVTCELCAKRTETVILHRFQPLQRPFWLGPFSTVATVKLIAHSAYGLAELR